MKNINTILFRRKNFLASIQGALKTAVPIVMISILSGCAVLDPQHLITRRFGNEAPPAGVALSPQLRQDAYDFVWNRVNEAYFDPNFNGVDWKLAGQTHYPRIMNATSDSIFWRNLDEMVAELGDAHTRVLSAKQYVEDKQKQGVSLGLNLMRMDEQIIVVSTSKNSPAEQAGLKAGDRILEIDEQNALAWWQTYSDKARKNSTERAREKSVRRILNSGDPELERDEVRLNVERADQSQFKVELKRAVLPRRDTLDAKLVEDNLGYVRLTGFDPKLNSSIADKIAQVKSSDGLIIDLRGNGGGSLEMALNLMNHFVDRKTFIGDRKTRTGKAPSLFFGLFPTGGLRLELSGKENAYDKPIAVLIDRDSASASEFVSGSLQALGRARVFGGTSCGCLLAYLGYANVPGGGALAYSEVDFVPLRGPRIEGNGVVPDVSIAVTRNDLIERRDRTFEAAKEWLLSQRKSMSLVAQ
ncbi:S41 family peptidase [Undibacterium cyanobacteriorum]|uniref:S41 family peptidase n=1 Tax=Undibacterium cyanobacteriorum TaxID=3073561 RepID=A0ABY9RDC1_9BURK|nr:S41 family peptidase [Undibacterium sp. 20NA77.5]WMW79238.1 S41 family peptidase [Undibacterium sp. 20NA77.5]